jgi:Gpi18-like mannosyltransferase
MKAEATAGQSHLAISSLPDYRERGKLLLRAVIVPFVYTRLLLICAGCFAIYRLPAARADGWDLPTGSAAIDIWSHFDGRWYLTIARDGYQLIPGQQSNVVFAPLFPMLMRLGGLLAGGSDRAFLIAGVVISNLALIVTLVYVMDLLLLEGYDQTVAARAAWYVLIFPTSFFLSAVYPMSLFMAISTAAFFHARKEHWRIAGLLAGLAALSRPDGVLLTAGLAVEYFQQRGFSLRREILNLIWGPAGLLAWMAFQWRQFGDPLTFVAVQKQWNYCPLLTVLHSSRAGLQLGCPALLAVMTVLAIRRLRPCYTVFTIAMFSVMLMAQRYWSITRFILVLFPAFMMLAIVGRRWRIVHLLYSSLSTPLSVILMMRFSLNLWVA